MELKIKMNEKDREYSIGPYNCNYDQFCQILSQYSVLENVSNAKRIKGPFDGKINSIYRVDLDAEKSVIFRTRISKAFRYEKIVKEKILYPLLDRSINIDTENLYEKIQALSNKKAGSYIFSAENHSIVPVQDMYYYYEPEDVNIQQNLNGNIDNDPNSIIPPNKFPYLLTIKQYIHGMTLYDLIQSTAPDKLNTPAILNVFEQSGEMLAKLHTVKFGGFYDKIMDIGSDIKPQWSELFLNQWNHNLKDASQYKAIQPLVPAIEKYFQENRALAEGETEAVLFHNDYQSQNIILSSDNSQPLTSADKYNITGIIDFDNWRIGTRAQDFVKMEYWTIQGNQDWLSAFYRGYSRHHQIDQEIKTRIELYKLLWFLLVYAFEMDKVKKNELNTTVDSRFPSAEKYLEPIKQIVEKFL
jgi:fructosamine-3-kinase